MMTEVQNTFSEALINNLYAQTEQIIGGNLTLENMFGVLVNLMQVVEHYKEIKGIQKKQLILLVLNKYINQHIVLEGDALLLKNLVQKSLPMVIDTIVSIDKKELAIKIKKCRSIFC